MAGSTARQKLIRRYRIPVCHSTVHSFPVPVLCTLRPHGLKILTAGLSTSVLDRHRFDADSNPDPNVHCDANPFPDPVKTMAIRLRILRQVLPMLEIRIFFSFLKKHPSYRRSLQQHSKANIHRFKK
jgi:hypothetical protein